MTRHLIWFTPTCLSPQQQRARGNGCGRDILLLFEQSTKPSAPCASTDAEAQIQIYASSYVTQTFATDYFGWLMAASWWLQTHMAVKVLIVRGGMMFALPLKVIVASQQKSSAVIDFTARQVCVGVCVCESWVYDCVVQTRSRAVSCTDTHAVLNCFHTMVHSANIERIFLDITKNNNLVVTSLIRH